MIPGFQAWLGVDFFWGEVILFRVFTCASYNEREKDAYGIWEGNVKIQVEWV